MLSRCIKNQIEQRLSLFPAVTLLGPRQSGKTTLAKTLSPLYFDMETDGDRNRLDAQWGQLIKQNQLIVLDEAQTYPTVFPRIRSAIDLNRHSNGRFLLLGSVSPALMKNVSESLAGRLSLVELTPLIFDEIPSKNLDSLWFYGGYPDGGILKPELYPQWQKDYLTILTQRDLPNWGLPAKPAMTQRLLQMLCATHGQCWNASKISQSLAMDYKTTNSYMEYLTGSYIIRRLDPFYANLKKRLIKSPKFYWRDSGLLHSMLNISDFNALLSHPSVGASWEGFVIEQILAKASCLGLHYDPFYFRTSESDHKEIDLIIDSGDTLSAIEIKLTSTPSTQDIAQLNKVADLIGAQKRILICRAEKPIVSDNLVVSDLPYFLSVLHQLLQT
jgi:predicted AAA+ superfamily ATPase